MIGRNLNPFRRKGEKPVAFWSGIVDADATTREVQYTVPDYFNGTLRVFAVAVSDERIGVTEDKVLVRGDFVLTPAAPLTVTPGDEFDVSTGVANNVAGSGANARVRVGLAGDATLEIVGAASQDVAIAEGREGTARFRVKVRDRLGSGVLKFTAALGNAGATRTIDMSVRPASPYLTTLKAGMLPKGSTEVALARNLYPQFRTQQAGVSTLPLQLAHGFVSYLARYPYVCTEQLVSQAMPATLLARRPEFGYVKTQPGADLGALVDELRMRQNDAGAYRLWPGADSVVEFVSLYAQHWLLEAQERGEPVPDDLIRAGNGYLVQLASRDGNNLADERQSAYAIYLLTRQGRPMTAEIAAMRKRLAERYAKEWPQDLTAGWLAASLSLMKQDREALQLVRGLRFDAKAPYTALRRRDDARRAAALHPRAALPVAAGVAAARGAAEPRAARHARRIPVVVGGRYAAGARQLCDGHRRRTRGVVGRGCAAGRRRTATAAVAGRFAAARRRRRHRPGAALHQRQPAHGVLPDRAVRLRPPASVAGDTAGPRGGPRVHGCGRQGAAEGDRRPGSHRAPRAARTGRSRRRTDRAGGPVAGRLRTRRAAAGAGPSLCIGRGWRRRIAGRGWARRRRRRTGRGGNGRRPRRPARRIEAGPASSARRARRRRCNTGEMREDRAVFYVDSSRDLREVTYRIKATNAGTFAVPPAFGEAMYDRSVQGRSTGTRLTVIRP